MSLGESFFSRMYADTDDPWGFRTRWYERRKRAVVLASLPQERYRRSFEPGCANGELTVALAGRCDEVVGTDVSERAVEAARARTADLPGVRVRRLAVPAEWPDGSFDLVVLSEMAYYLDDADLDRLVARAAASLEPGGVLLACHWRHPVPDYPQSGDAVHERLGAAGEWRRTARHVEEDFLLEVFVVPPGDGGRLSVAARTGLIG